MDTSPIFIVGVPRSGTTLLAAMLSAHSRISCGPETHFFRRLAQADAGLLCAEETWPLPAAQFVNSITHTSYNDANRKPLLEKYTLDQESVLGYLRAQPPGIASILSSVTALYMNKMGKARWAEKTPDHMDHVETIRKYFPTSPVIRIVRDPRDAAASLTKVPWGAANYAEALFLWKQKAEGSDPFFQTDGNCYTLRYEDLVMDPEREMQALCNFLGEVFEISMLDTSTTGRQINSRNVPWKENVSKPLDTSRVAAWRTTLEPEQNILAEALLGDQMQKYGYVRTEKLDRYGKVIPNAFLNEKFADGLIRVAGTGVRFWKQTPDEAASAQVFLGDPGESDWLVSYGSGKLGSTVQMARQIVGSNFSGMKTFWIPNPDARRWSGYSAQLLKLILSPHKI